MPKRQLLPPTAGTQKREVSVNLRFSAEDHERLKQVAEFSQTNVSSLLFYVTINTTLPLMEKEMKRVQAETAVKPASPPKIEPPEKPKLPAPKPE